MSKIVEIIDLTLVLQGKTILKIPYFSLDREESICLTGPNGAGKSTLLSVMAALQEPTAGTVSLLGKNVKDQSFFELRRRIAVVFQKPMMFDLTVIENLELGLKYRGMNRREREKRIYPWLEKMKLTHLTKRRARSLSGGEAQRVALAQALILKPEIIFLDEPFANLDREMRQGLIDEIGKTLKAEKIATVMVTHHRKEAAAVSDSIYHMEDGEIINREFLTFQNNPG